MKFNLQGKKMSKFCFSSLYTFLSMVLSSQLAHAAEPGPYAILTGLFGVVIINAGPFLLIVLGLKMLVTFTRTPPGVPGKLKNAVTASVFLLIAVLTLGFRVLTWYAPSLALIYDNVYSAVYYGFPALLLIALYFLLRKRRAPKSSENRTATPTQKTDYSIGAKKPFATPFLWATLTGVMLIAGTAWFRFENYQDRRIKEQYRRDHPSVAILNQQAAADLAQMRQDLERYQKTGVLPKVERKRDEPTTLTEKPKGESVAKTDSTIEADKTLPPDNVLAGQVEKEVSSINELDKINDLAKKAYYAKNYRRATALWAWLISKDPSQGKFYINIGMTLRNLNENERAKIHVLKGITLMPKNGWAYHTCCTVLYSNKDYLGSIRAGRQAIIYGYDNTDSRYSLACALAAYYWQCTEQDGKDRNSKEMKNLRWEAVKAFRKMHEADPNSFAGVEGNIKTNAQILRQDLDKPVWLMYFGI